MSKTNKSEEYANQKTKDEFEEKKPDTEESKPTAEDGSDDSKHQKEDQAPPNKNITFEDELAAIRERRIERESQAKRQKFIEYVKNHLGDVVAVLVALSAFMTVAASVYLYWREEAKTDYWNIDSSAIVTGGEIWGKLLKGIAIAIIVVCGVMLFKRFCNKHTVVANALLATVITVVMFAMLYGIVLYSAGAMSSIKTIIELSSSLSVGQQLQLAAIVISSFIISSVLMFVQWWIYFKYWKKMGSFGAVLICMLALVISMVLVLLVPRMLYFIGLKSDWYSLWESFQCGVVIAYLLPLNYVVIVIFGVCFPTPKPIPALESSPSKDTKRNNNDRKSKGSQGGKLVWIFLPITLCVLVLFLRFAVKRLTKLCSIDLQNSVKVVVKEGEENSTSPSKEGYAVVYETPDLYYLEYYTCEENNSSEEKTLTVDTTRQKQCSKADGIVTRTYPLFPFSLSKDGSKVTGILN